MDRSLFVALSGAKMQEKRLEAISNNLANANTVGFKKDIPVFKVESPDGGIREFADDDGVSVDFTQGSLREVRNPLNVAIVGEGFFEVEGSNGPMYTRQGSFTVDSEGSLVTGDGRKVVGTRGEIRITSPSIEIDITGQIIQDGTVTDRLKVVNFADPNQLLKAGGYFINPTNEDPDISREIEIHQGFLEMSNVNVIHEMVSMIEAQRAYETQSKMIQTIDDNAKRAIDEVGSGR